MNKKKLNLSGPFAFILAILVLLIFVPVNLIVKYYDKVYDMTPSKRYTLNQKTVDLLDETKDKEIDVYYLSKLQYLQDNPEYLSLYHTLTQLDARDNITLHCIDPDKDVATAQMLDPTGIIGMGKSDVFVKCGDVIKRVEEARIFQKVNGVLHYDGEELISGAIKTVTKGSLPTVYFLTGHGEKSIYAVDNDESSGYGTEHGFGMYARQLFAKNYDVKELDLDKAGTIPANAAIITLAGPEKDLTAKEAELISEYLDNGGSVSFLIGPSETEGRFKNIEKILDKFGIQMDYNVVKENNPICQFENRDYVKDPTFLRVEFVDNTGAENDYTEDLTSELIMLIDNGAYTPGVSNTRSFYLMDEYSFADASTTEVGYLFTNTPDPSNKDEAKYTTDSQAMGGDKTTVEEADGLDEKELALGVYGYNKATGGKIVALGSKDMVDADEMWPTTGGVQALTLFSNTWLYDADDSLGVGTKINSYDYMQFSSAGKAKATIAILIIFPLAVAVIGVLVWLKRRHA
ncbi:MAG: GldG family protein [Ruminococcus sp.]|nr:GldG family protein [Ruminococcus sp.]